ncbi:MAG: uroporphyrinogen decarboxylase family protein [Clostridia bacterium]|nr:uroporphyrinogen decarboxylase family protein [Clostridia bacterium]
MKNRDRIVDTLNFKMPDDRLPMIEWAGWWDKTQERFHNEGVPRDLSRDEIREYLGLDMMRQFWISPKGKSYRDASKEDKKVYDMDSYLRVKNMLYPEDAVDVRREQLEKLKPLHADGDCAVWITLEGFFWFPRTLFGIEEHLYAFYDQPETMHKINSDLAEYNIYLIEEFCKIIKPDFMTFAEDMSYNLGPMLSYGQFKEFLLPYYKKVITVLNKYGIIPMVDTDGQLEAMIPWLQEAGIEGALPLERQAGVDVERMRNMFPDFKIIGAYDKMVMSKGEEAMRKEWERLLPVMKKGGFIPSCDHQTPPEVSLENYRIYLKLMKEYCEKAVK